MTYILTLWLIWTPADGVLVQYEAPSCAQAFIEVMASTRGDGVRRYSVVRCRRIQEV